MKTSEMLESYVASDSPKNPTSKPVASEPSGPPLVSLNSVLFREISVELSAGLGQVTLPVAEILALKAGSNMIRIGTLLFGERANSQK